MAPINWEPVEEDPQALIVGDRAESNRLWSEANPVVQANENVLVLRFTTTLRLADLLNAVVNHYGRWITSTVITKESKGKQTTPFVKEGLATWYSEGLIVITLGAPSLNQG